MISIYNLCPQNFRDKIIFLSFSSRNKLLDSFLRLNGYLENKKQLKDLVTYCTIWWLVGRILVKNK